MPGLRIAKADKDDIETTMNFLQACESFWDNRPMYSLRPIAFDWEMWDDEDPDKILLLQIRKDVAAELGCDEDDVDNRVLIYEFLRIRYQQCDCNWGRVMMAADVLIDNVCDPTENHLAFHPGYDFRHVENEM